MSIFARRLQRKTTKRRIYRHSFDAGTNTGTVSPSVNAPGDTPWRSFAIGGGGSFRYDNTYQVQGSYSARVQAANTLAVGLWNTSAMYKGAFRYYVRWPSNPTNDVVTLWVGSDNPSRRSFSINTTSTGSISVINSGSAVAYATPANSLPLNQWARVEILFQADPTNAANGRLRLALYAGESTTPIADSGLMTTSVATTPIKLFRIGKYDTSASNVAYWMDSLALIENATNFVGPYSAPTNLAPVANAGAAQTVTAGQTVTLNGSASNDPDGTIASYAWTQTAGPAVVLSSTTVAQPTFTAPNSSGSLTFSLVVTDNNGTASSPATVTVSVQAQAIVRKALSAGAAAIGTTNYAVPATNTVWVATSGDDTNGSGTQSNPYRSLKKAAAVAPANSTIIIRGGEYLEGGVWWRAQDATAQGNATLVGIAFANDGVTVQNYPGEAVWFDGSDVTSGWTFDGTNWRLPFVTKYDRTPTHSRGLSAANWPGGGGFVNPAFPYAAYPEQMFYDGQQLSQVDKVADLGPGKFAVEGAMYGGTSENQNVFITTAYVMRDNPTGHEVRISTRSRMMSVLKSGVTIRGIGIRRYAPAIADIGSVYMNASAPSSALRVENVIVEDSANLGLSLNSQGGVVSRCTFRRNGILGLGLRGDNTVCEHSLFQQNNFNRFNYGPDAGGLKSLLSWNQIMRYNRFESTYGHSLWFDMSCYNSAIYGNDFIDSYGHAIAYEISARGYIVDNYIQGTGVNSDISPKSGSNPIWISGSNNCEVWNNTIVDSDVHMLIGQDYRVPTAPGTDGYGKDTSRPVAFHDGSDPNYPYNGEMTWTVTRTIVKNNIFYNLKGFSSVQSTFHTVYDDSASGSYRTRRNTADFGTQTGGNLYNRLNTSSTPRFANGTLVEAGGVEIYSNFTSNSYRYPSGTSGPSWKTVTGETGSSLVDNSNATTTGAYPYEIKPAVLSGITLAPLDSTVASKLDSNYPAGSQHLGAWLQ